MNRIDKAITNLQDIDYIYKDYVNNYISISKFSKDYDIDYKKAVLVLDIARLINHNFSKQLNKINNTIHENLENKIII